MRKAATLDSFQFGVMARQKAEVVRPQIDAVITEARAQQEARADDPEGVLVLAAVRKVEQAADEAVQKLDALAQVAYEFQSGVHG